MVSLTGKGLKKPTNTLKASESLSGAASLISLHSL